MSVIFQSYEDISEAPENVQQIIALMRRPLRDAQRLASLPSMSPFALAQLQRIPEVGADVDRDSSDAMFDQVASVANLVLSTCAAIQEQMNRGSVEARTIPHWYTLLRTIAKSCHRDAEFLGDISFIYPHGFGGESGNATIFAGFSAGASLVSSNLEIRGVDTEFRVPLCMEQHLGSKTDQAASPVSSSEETPGDGEQVEDSNMNTDEDGFEDSGSVGDDNDHSGNSSSYELLDNHPMLTAVPRYRPIPQYDAAYFLFGPDPTGVHTPMEEPCLDLPLDTQILAERRTWPSVYFPIICLASGKDIIPLVASSVYQRRTWNLDIPVVAFEISSYGSLVHVYIGWSDSSEDEDMSSVRILRPSYPNGSNRSIVVSASQGTFDLATPQSALEFASFMLSLGDQIDGLREDLPSRHLRNLTWRADNDNTTWAESIRDWRLSVDSSHTTSSTDNSAATQTDVAISTKTGAKTSSRLSCSELAKKAAKSIKESEDTTIASWMLSRSTFSVAYVPDWTPTAFDPPQFTEMMEAYKALTSFQWPKGWTALTELPPVDRCLTLYRDTLFSEYKARYGATQVEYLTEHQTDIIASRLSLLFKSVNDARTQDARLTTTLEAESRHSFDALFVNFFVDKVKQITSPDVFFERQLRLPDNALLQGLSSNWPRKCVAGLTTRMGDWAAHNTTVYAHFSRLEASMYTTTLDDENDAPDEDSPDEVPPDLTEQCRQSAAASLQLQGDFQQLCPGKSTTQLLSHIEMQQKREPPRGTCDTLLVTSIPLPEGKKVLSAYNASRLIIARYPSDTKSVTESEGAQPDVTMDVVSSSELQQQKTTLGHSGTDSECKSTTHDGSQTVRTTQTQIESLGSGPQANGQKRLPPHSQTEEGEKMKSPLAVESGNYKPYKFEPDPNINFQNTTRCIMVPQLTVEYKKPEDEELKALNQSRMYNGASIKSSAAMGITEYPFFTLSVHGQQAALLMGWQASNGATYIVERNVQKFNILQPLQAFHLATVILRLKARDAGLKQIYEEKCGAYREKLQKGIFDKWAMPESKPRKKVASAAATP